MNASHIRSIDLGKISLKKIHDSEYVNTWVRTRAFAMGADLKIYEFHIDEKTGNVTLRMKALWDNSAAARVTIKYDN